MKEEEDIASYPFWVDGFVNTIRGLSETIHESVTVQKELRSLPLWFHGKVPFLEDRKNLGSLTIYELHGILIAY